MRFSDEPVLYINTGSRRAEGEVAQNAGNLMLVKEYEVVYRRPTADILRQTQLLP